MAALVDRLISDSSSPYYLHYGDNTEMQLTNVMLTEENYATWSPAVIMALSVKNKEGFIDGSIVKPSLNDLLYGACRRCNHVVSSWIINSILKGLYPSMMHEDSAREIWTELAHMSLKSKLLRFLKQIVLLTLISIDSRDFRKSRTTTRISVTDLSTWMMIGVGKLEDGLYHFQQPEHQSSDQSSRNFQHLITNSIVFHSSNNNSVSSLKCNKGYLAACTSLNNIVVNTNIDVWHCRLGHIPVSKLSFYIN